MAPQRAAVAALCLLLCAAVGSQAKTITSAADFLEVNGGDMQCMVALLARSGLADALAADLPNTYFLPTDSAFLMDLGQTAPALGMGTDMDESRSLTVPQILGMIEAMPEEDAVAFVKAHVVPESYPTVESLAFPNGRPAVDAKEGDAAVAPVTVKNSLGLAMEVVYETAASNLYLSVTYDKDTSNAFVAGPVSFPVGQATVYTMLNILGNGTAITAGRTR